MSNTLLNANAEARFLRHIENLVNGQPISEWDLECLLHTLINAAFSYKEQRLSVHTRTELLRYRSLLLPLSDRYSFVSPPPLNDPYVSRFIDMTTDLPKISDELAGVCGIQTLKDVS